LSKIKGRSDCPDLLAPSLVPLSTRPYLNFKYFSNKVERISDKKRTSQSPKSTSMPWRSTPVSGWG